MVGSTKRVEVAFAGDGSGVDELAWGQREIWVSMPLSPIRSGSRS
ncbi:MAG TPA: hypothetical protein VF223_20810 [Trebonia sp.]